MRVLISSVLFKQLAQKVAFKKARNPVTPSKPTQIPQPTRKGRKAEPVSVDRSDQHQMADSISARVAQVMLPVAPTKLSKTVTPKTRANTDHVPASQLYLRQSDQRLAHPSMMSPPTVAKVWAPQLYTCRPDGELSRQPFNSSPRIQSHEMPAFASHEFFANFPDYSIIHPIAQTGMTQTSSSAGDVQAARTPSTGNARSFVSSVPADASLVSVANTTAPAKAISPPRKSPTRLSSRTRGPALTCKPLPHRPPLSKQSASFGGSSVSSSNADSVSPIRSPLQLPQSAKSPNTGVPSCRVGANLTPSPMHHHDHLAGSPSSGTSGNLAPSPLLEQYRNISGVLLDIDAILPVTPTYLQLHINPHLVNEQAMGVTRSPMQRQRQNPAVPPYRMSAPFEVTPTRCEHQVSSRAQNISVGPVRQAPTSEEKLSASSSSSLSGSSSGSSTSTGMPIDRDAHDRHSSSGSSNTTLLTPKLIGNNHEVLPAANSETCPPPGPILKAAHRRNTSSCSGHVELLPSRQSDINLPVVTKAASQTCVQQTDTNMEFSHMRQQYQVLEGPADGSAVNFRGDLHPISSCMPATLSGAAHDAIPFGDNQPGRDTSSCSSRTVPLISSQ